MWLDKLCGFRLVTFLKIYIMEITGKVTKILDPISGESKNGPWRKQSFVIETDSDYPKKICFTVWGDKVDFTQITESDKVKVFFDIESREYNNNWYTDLKAWKAELVQAGGTEPRIEQAPLDQMEIPPEISEDDGGDLPF